MPLSEGVGDGWVFSVVQLKMEPLPPSTGTYHGQNPSLDNGTLWLAGVPSPNVPAKARRPLVATTTVPNPSPPGLPAACSSQGMMSVYRPTYGEGFVAVWIGARSPSESATHGVFVLSNRPVKSFDEPIGVRLNSTRTAFVPERFTVL